MGWGLKHRDIGERWWGRDRIASLDTELQCGKKVVGQAQQDSLLGRQPGCEASSASSTLCTLRPHHRGPPKGSLGFSTMAAFNMYLAHRMLESNLCFLLSRGQVSWRQGPLHRSMQHPGLGAERDHQGLPITREARQVTMGQARDSSL